MTEYIFSLIWLGVRGILLLCAILLALPVFLEVLKFLGWLVATLGSMP